MKKWTADHIPNQSKKIIIVTGANSGLGYESVYALSKKGATIVMACRNMRKGENARNKILEKIPDAQIDLKHLDLADLESVNEFSANILKDYEGIDVLLNNAGIMATPYAESKDGFEMQLAINHLGHFALTGRLLKLILSTPGSRIVNVSSIAAKRGKINFDDLMSKNSYIPWEAYAQSKLANQLFTYELQRKLDENDQSTLCVAAHPGVAMTKLHRNMGINQWLVRIGEFLISPFLSKASKGVLPQLMASTAPGIEPGGYYGPQGFREMSGHPGKADIPPQAKDRDTAEKLWDISEKLTGVTYTFQGRL